MLHKLTKTKAKKILKDGTVRGKKLTAKQKRFFGAIAGGQKPFKGNPGKSAPKGMHKMPGGHMMKNSEMQKMIKKTMGSFKHS